MCRFLLLLVLVTLAGCATDPPADPEPAAEPVPAADPAPAVLTLSDAFAPAAPEDGTSAVFVEIGGGAEADTLVGARFDGAAQVEVHETYDAGEGLRGMRQVEGGIPVPAGEGVSLRPGGFHVMLIGLAAPLAAGDTLDVALDFARAGAQPLRVPVRALADFPTEAPSD
ncbi:MAG: copper chaperone PCu(A)C [Bacteroidota bacterium]